MAPRVIPPERLSTVVETAARVFIRHGYRRTQIQDIAEALGLAKGTLYGYADSKEALFAAALRYADGTEPMPDVSGLPLPRPAPGELAAVVAGRLGAELPDLALTRVRERAELPSSPAGAAAEVSEIIVDLYRRLARHRMAIKLVDRCASELPELASVWLEAGRGAQMSAMEGYLRDRQAAGLLEVPGSVPVAARTAVELCVLWAVHCHFDEAPPQTTPVDDETVAATVAAMVARSLTATRPDGGS
jgi:AcrR family transcriptional regulator